MIAIQNISKKFKGMQAIVQLYLAVAEGEIYGLLGSNGAGKSTTLNILLGFLKPDDGKTLVNGIDTSSDADEARKQIG